MKFYSEITEQLYDTEEQLNAAEMKEVMKRKAAKEKEQEELRKKKEDSDKKLTAAKEDFSKYLKDFFKPNPKFWAVDPFKDFNFFKTSADNYKSLLNELEEKLDELANTLKDGKEDNNCFVFGFSVPIKEKDK